MSNLNKYQKILLNMFDDVVSYCEKNNIPYFLVEGSCLGAIRHEGFIPWDDDIDITIPIEYYNKFCVNNNTLRNNYQITGINNEDDILRVVDTNIKIINGIDKGGYFTHPVIDVFILFGLPKNRFLQLIHYYRLWFHHKLFLLADPDRILVRKRGFLAQTVIKMNSIFKFGRILKLNKQDQIKKMKEIGLKYPCARSSYVVTFPSWYGKLEIMKKEVYGDGVMVPFETIKARVPQKFDEYLTQLYGDYKQLPPESERVGKHQITIVE